MLFTTRGHIFETFAALFFAKNMDLLDSKLVAYHGQISGDFSTQNQPFFLFYIEYLQTNFLFSNDKMALDRASLFLNKLDSSIDDRDLDFDFYILKIRNLFLKNKNLEAKYYIDMAKQINSEKGKREEVKLLFEEAFWFLSQNDIIGFERILNRIEQLIEITPTDSEYLKIELIRNKIILLLEKKEIVNLEHWANSGLRLIKNQKEKDQENLLFFNNALAIGNIYQRSYVKALSKLEMVVEVAKKIGNQRQICKSYINIGNIYAQHFQFEAAYGFYQKSLFDYGEFLSVKDKCHLLNNYGNAIYNLGDYSEAETLFVQAKNLAQKIGNNRLYLYALTQLEKVQLKMENRNGFQKTNRETKDVLNRFENLKLNLIGEINNAKALFVDGEMQKALGLLKKTYVRAGNENDDASKIRTQKLLIEIYKKLDKQEAVKLAIQNLEKLEKTYFSSPKVPISKRQSKRQIQS